MGQACSTPRSNAKGIETGLYMLQPYEPGKIPVVLVHGLFSSPRAYIQTINELSNHSADRIKISVPGVLVSDRPADPRLGGQAPVVVDPGAPKRLIRGIPARRSTRWCWSGIVWGACSPR